MPRTKLDDNKHIMQYVRAIWDDLGKPDDICELCGAVGPTLIHHTKYKGATINDLVYACSSCNNKPENQHLV